MTPADRNRADAAAERFDTTSEAKNKVKRLPAEVKQSFISLREKVVKGTSRARRSEHVILYSR